jgi:hypothetical protein
MHKIPQGYKSSNYQGTLFIYTGTTSCLINRVNKFICTYESLASVSVVESIGTHCHMETYAYTVHISRSTVAVSVICHHINVTYQIKMIHHFTSTPKYILNSLHIIIFNFVTEYVNKYSYFLKICHHTKLQDAALNGTCNASISQVHMDVMLVLLITRS